jgi:hypothetical protein
MIFRDLNLEKNLIENLESLGYKTLTPIQENSLKYSLEKKDIIARAKTGSGKTLAFCLPIINNLDKKKYRVQSLILAPTRELATQIAQTMREVLRSTPNIKVLTLCGGVPYKPQVVSLSHEAGVCGFTDPDNRKTYPWGAENKDLISFHKDMIQIHKESEALRVGSFTFLMCEQNIVGYARFTKEE